MSQDQPGIKVTIIVFTLNETDGMKVIMPRIRPEWYDQLIVVDGGSTDGTVEYARQAGYYLFRQEKRGPGSAFLESMARAAGDIVIVLSPDGNSIPEKIPELVAKMREGYDIVIVSRYRAGAKSYDDDCVTAFGNRMFTTIINLLFRTRITDSLVMYRAYRKALIAELKIDTPAVSWGTQVLARAARAGKRIGEIPGDEPPRIGGVRKMHPLKNGISELKMICREFCRQAGDRHACPLHRPAGLAITPPNIPGSQSRKGEGISPSMYFFKGKKILVTGAAGFVGTNLLQRLAAEGGSIRATVHKRPPSIKAPAIEYITCDLTDPADCRRAVEGIDYIFHCAASTSGAAVIAATPLVHVTPNIVMNAWLLEAAYFARVKKFLWLSSSTGYPASDDPVREEEMFVGDPYEKYFGVGWMKRYTEVLCRMYAEKLKDPMATIVLRPTNIYGEHDDFDFATSHVFAALIRRVAERRDPFEVWGTGEDVRDLIYVGDLVDCMLLAMERLDRFAALNVGLGKGYSVRELLSLMLAAAGHQPRQITFDPAKPAMIPKRLVDITRARELLGFEPVTAIEEGIRKTLAWYQAHPYHHNPA